MKLSVTKHEWLVNSTRKIVITRWVLLSVIVHTNGDIEEEIGAAKNLSSAQR